MSPLSKTVNLSRPFQTAASIAIGVCAAYALFKTILILIDSQTSNFLSVLTAILEIIISTSVSLLTILFLLVAIEYLARRQR